MTSKYVKATYRAANVDSIRFTVGHIRRSIQQARTSYTVVMLTPYPDVNHILERLLFQLHQRLGTKLVGVYLGGSLAVGGFDPRVSDIDLAVALASDLDDEDYKSLRRMHVDIANSYPHWDDRIEVCYVPADALRNIRTDRRPVVNISPGEPFHWTPLQQGWLVSWYELREHGLALHGPDASTLIEPISQDEFVRLLVYHARSWIHWINTMKRRQQQAYAILSICRTLYGIQHGQQVSKQRAAQWVAYRFPEWAGLINNALIWRVTPDHSSTDHEATFPDTVRLINAMSAEVSDVFAKSYPSTAPPGCPG